MRWSKLKSLVEEQFSTSLGKRISIFSTRYGNCTCGRAWITLDGREIATFCTRAEYNVSIGESKRENPPLGYGELSRQDAYESCWAVVHDLSIEEALSDSDPLVQSLAVLDRRFGKRRMKVQDWANLHPLAQLLFSVRLQSEGMAIPVGLSQNVTT